jgi:hypothetical protein
MSVSQITVHPLDDDSVSDSSALSKNLNRIFTTAKELESIYQRKGDPIILTSMHSYLFYPLEKATYQGKTTKSL